MLRMIGTKFKEWIKSLSQRIHPGSGEGDVEIGGKLTVDGDLDVNSDANINGKISFDAIKGDFQIMTLYGDDTAIMFSGISPHEATIKNAYGYNLNFTNSGVNIGYSEPSSSTPKTGFAIQPTLFRIIFQEDYTTVSLIAKNIELTGTNLTGTLIQRTFEQDEKYIPSINSLHFNSTADLGTETSGNLSFTSTKSMLTGEYTGVLIHGGVLVGPCYVNIATSQTQLTLSYQNPLGLTLGTGEYSVALTKILPN